MAEYYPLLAKAIAGLPNSTPETRRAVYERARKALLGQLQSLQPPVPEADLRREIEALDAAVARLEAESGGAPQPSPVPQPAVQPQRPVAKPAVPPRPAPPRQPVPPQAPARSPAAARPNGAAVLAGEPAAPAGARSPENAAAPPAPKPPSEPPPVVPRQQSAPAREPRVEPRTRISAAARPVAPQPDLGDTPQNHRLWIVAGVVVVLVALVAVAAWKLRDRPDQLAAFKPSPQTSAAANDKNTQRVGGPPPPAPAVTEATPAATPAAPAPAAESAPAAAGRPADANNPVPVAYRAALLVEAPDEPNKVKTYVGTVIWKTENVSNGPGQPLASAVHADIDVPDDKLKATIDIQKNSDPSLSASHTITFVFSLAPDSPTGGVKEISLPQLRSEDNPGGEPLKGIVVPIMDNSFLVGLARGDAEAHNAELLKKLEWIDIPIMLNNGRIAKLTFEKNTSGTRAINDAFASWQAQQ